MDDLLIKALEGKGNNVAIVDRQYRELGQKIADRPGIRYFWARKEVTKEKFHEQLKATQYKWILF